MNQNLYTNKKKSIQDIEVFSISSDNIYSNKNLNSYEDNEIKYSPKSKDSSIDSDDIYELILKKRKRNEMKREETRINKFKAFEAKREKRKKMAKDMNKNKDINYLITKVFVLNESIYLENVRLFTRFSWNYKPSSITFECSGRDKVCKGKIKIENNKIVEIVDHNQEFCKGKKTLDRDIQREADKSQFFKAITDLNHYMKCKFT